jgi:RAP1 GTPase activating protein 1
MVARRAKIKLPEVKGVQLSPSVALDDSDEDMAPLFDERQLAGRRDGEQWLIESGDPDSLDLLEEYRRNSSAVFLIDTQRYTLYYDHYFYGKPHQMLMGYDSHGGPVFVAVENPDESELDEITRASTFVRALVITTAPYTEREEAEHWVMLPACMMKHVKRELRRNLPAEDLTLSSRLRLIEHRDADHDFHELEQALKASFTNYKFGLVYCEEGQLSEREMFANRETSQEYEQFLDFLGERVDMYGWPKFAGGLETKRSGHRAIYSKLQNFQIIFHVATLLPFDDADALQVQRKRHVGNDVVVVVFKEGDQPLPPGLFVSKFNHIVCIVQVDRKRTLATGRTHYRLSVASRSGSHSFAPMLPYPPVFEATDRFLTFFLTKLINSERSAMYLPEFSTRLARTRTTYMQTLAEKYAPIAGFKDSEVAAARELAATAGRTSQLNNDGIDGIPSLGATDEVIFFSASSKSLVTAGGAMSGGGGDGDSSGDSSSRPPLKRDLTQKFMIKAELKSKQQAEAAEAAGNADSSSSSSGARKALSSLRRRTMQLTRSRSESTPVEPNAAALQSAESAEERQRRVQQHRFSSDDLDPARAQAKQQLQLEQPRASSDDLALICQSTHGQRVHPIVSPPRARPPPPARHNSSPAVHRVRGSRGQGRGRGRGARGARGIRGGAGQFARSTPPMVANPAGKRPPPRAPAAAAAAAAAAVPTSPVADASVVVSATTTTTVLRPTPPVGITSPGVGRGGAPPTVARGRPPTRGAAATGPTFRGEPPQSPPPRVRSSTAPNPPVIVKSRGRPPTRSLRARGRGANYVSPRGRATAPTPPQVLPR